MAVTLANRLRPWLAGKAAGTPVFDGLTDRTAEMLRVDLEAAGIPYETAAGVVDFHALRAAYVSNLVASGASVKTCQTLARHSSPSLTIGVYAKNSLHDIKGAVEKLPDPSSRDSVPVTAPMAKSAQVATPISWDFGHYLATAEAVSIQGESVTGVILDSVFEFPMDQNPMVMTGLDAAIRDALASDGNAPRRTRTYNPLIKSQTYEFRKGQSGKGLRSSTSPISHHFPTDACPSDLDLATVNNAWDRLPDSIKAGILAMVKVALK